MAMTSQTAIHDAHRNLCNQKDARFTKRSPDDTTIHQGKLLDDSRFTTRTFVGAVLTNTVKYNSVAILPQNSTCSHLMVF